MRFTIAVVVMISSFYAQALKQLPAGCQYDHECVIEVPGTYCADGTKSFITLTPRKDAKNLLVYLSGGGACWDKRSCSNGYARPLTRVEPQNDWNGGKGIHNRDDAGNPFRTDFDIVTIPYCTGDAFTGTRSVNYGTPDNQYVIHHVGYKNVQEFFKKIKAIADEPKKVALLGCSAGGIGAYYHLRTLKQNFPNAEKYVISDAGTPFKPPYVPAKNYNRIMANWGADKSLPPPLKEKPVTDFGGVIRSNTQTAQEVRFGFISAYRDSVMTFFAFAVGARSPGTAVRRTIIDVATNDIGEKALLQKVFYTNSSKHCHTGTGLSEMTSGDMELGTWLTQMMNNDPKWVSQRPDLDRKTNLDIDADFDPSFDSVSYSLGK